jgi:hypothetical protein
MEYNLWTTTKADGSPAETLYALPEKQAKDLPQTQYGPWMLGGRVEEDKLPLSGTKLLEAKVTLSKRGFFYLQSPGD